MEYIVKDISMQYEHGEEIIGTIDASNPDEAIYLALKEISPSMSAYIGDLFRNKPADFKKYILHDFEAIPKEKPCI